MKMDLLMQDVLRLSRITRGDMPRVPVDLDEVLADLMAQYPELEAAKQHIEISPSAWLGAR